SWDKLMKPCTPHIGPEQSFCFQLPSGSAEPRGHEHFNVCDRLRHFLHLHGVLDLEHLQRP
ncbi:MAG: hypothetical protein VX002_00450, partial [Bacteroidota bacterium]|nr:hypothetical protein [Bacteroidota bacterium]